VAGDGPTGQVALDVSGTTPTGDAVQIGVGAAGTHTLVAFLSSGCLTCQRIWDRLADPAPLSLPPATRLVVVTRDASAESSSTIARLSAGPVARGVEVVMSTAAWEGYEVPGSPYFAYVDGTSGRVRGEGSATDWEQVERLVGEAVGDGAHREARADRELLAAGTTPDPPHRH
jgi:hypothetical protein